MNLRRRVAKLELASPPPACCISCGVGGGGGGGERDGLVRRLRDATIFIDDAAPGWAHAMCKRCGRACYGRLTADGYGIERCVAAEMPGI